MGSDLINFGNGAGSHQLLVAFDDVIAVQIKMRIELYTWDVNYCHRLLCKDNFLPINTIHITLPYTLVDILYNGQ